MAALAGSAHAQSAEAQARFDDGVRLMKAHQLAEACAAFDTSNRLERRAGTLLRLGECREANHQLASAWSAYQDALTIATDPKKKSFAAARVKALEPKLSHLTLDVPAKSRIAGLAITRDGNAVDPGLWNVASPVDGGQIVIAANAAGHTPWTTTVAVPSEGGAITVDVPVLPDAPDTTPVRDKTPEHQDHPVREEAPQEASPSTFTTRRKVATGVVVGGLAVTVVGVVLARSATAKRDDAYGLCPDPKAECGRAADANALIVDAHDKAIQADVAFGVAAAAGVVASVLWFTGAPAERAHVEASVSKHGGGFAVVGRF